MTASERIRKPGCPYCHSGRYSRDDGAIICEGCGAVFPIRSEWPKRIPGEQNSSQAGDLAGYIFEQERQSIGFVDATLRCPTCGQRADMCFVHGEDWKKRGAR